MILAGKKRHTTRGLFLPTYVEGESILLRECDKEGKDRKVLRTVVMKVSFIKFLRLSEINDAVAEGEGFADAETLKEQLRNVYAIRSDDRWLVSTCWTDVMLETLDTDPQTKKKIVYPEKKYVTIEDMIARFK